MACKPNRKIVQYNLVNRTGPLQSEAPKHYRHYYILKRFCWLDDKMTAGIVRRSFYRLGVISAFCDRARHSSAVCLSAYFRPLRGQGLPIRLTPFARQCRRKCCSPVRQAPMIPPAYALHIRLHLPLKRRQTRRLRCDKGRRRSAAACCRVAAALCDLTIRPPDEEKDRTEEQHADQERDRHHHAYSFFVDHVHFSFILPPCRAPPGCAGRIPLRARAGRARNKSPE